MSTKVLPCKCKNEYQDAVHGQGNRVHNSFVPSNPSMNEGWRCTVCGSETVHSKKKE